MSMITGCPACGTMFRVVPDQLKISDGWVRCGHCAQVFDASANIRPQPPVGSVAAGPANASQPAEAELPEAAAAQPKPSEAAEPGRVVVPKLVREDEAGAAQGAVEAEPALRSRVDTAPAQDFAHSQSGSDSVADFADARFHPQEDPPSSFFEDSAPASRISGFQHSGTSGRVSGFQHSTSASARAGDEDAELDDVSFVREARRQALWSSPGVRLILILATVALAALLALQYGVRERDRLAATHPQLRPWLERLCGPLGCTVGPPRRIEAILIDSSGFTRLRPDTYRLSVALRNQSKEPVAVPALQLTLTDTQEQPVVQRVLTPRELGATSPTIAPTSEFTTSVALAVDPRAGAGRIAGYRVLAFYP